MSAHNYHPHCGCSDCCDTEEADERRDEHIEALLSDPKWVAGHKALADEWNDGTFSGEHYSDVERALADLADVHGADLIGSDALATVLRLAKIHGDARKDRLRELAEQEIDRQEAA